MNQAETIPRKQTLSGWLRAHTFHIIIAFALWMAYLARGVVLNGMLLGTVSTIAIWVLVARFPLWLKRLMSRHVLLCDLILTMATSSLIAVVGSGPTIFMALATQAVLLTLLLNSLGADNSEND